MVKDLSKASAVVEDSRKLPFTKEEMFGELRELILREAARIDLMRGAHATRAFLGFGYEADESQDNYSADQLARINLNDFALAGNFSLAYDYAFQVGKWIHFDEVVECRLRGVAHGFPAYGVEGGQSPYYADGSKCRHVVELAVARYQMTFYGLDPDIAQLALLANMSEAAVRNSLSQENIKPEGKPAKIPSDVAWSWLKKRRGFIPNRKSKNATETPREKTVRIFSGVYFGNAICHAALEAGFSGGQLAAEIAASAGVDELFVASLLEGRPTADLPALKAVAAVLGLYNPVFSSIAVELALEA